MQRLLLFLVTFGSLAVLAAAPTEAAAKGCGALKTDGGQTEVKDIATSSGPCVAARRVAKKFARTRVAPAGYSCTEKFTRQSRPAKANVRCSGKGRKITFKVTWNGSVPFPATPAPALPGS